MKFRWSMRIKLWISYLLVFTIPIILMATFGYLKLKESIEHDLYQRYTAYLKDAAGSVDDFFRQLDSMQKQFAQTNWVIKIVNMQGEVLNRNRVNAWDLLEYQQFVMACFRSIPQAQYLGVYFPRKNYTVSSNSTGSMDFLLQSPLRLPSLSKEELDDLVGNLREFMTIYRWEDEIYQYGRKMRGLLVFKSILKLPDSQSPGAVLMSFIPESQILSYLEILTSSEEFVSLRVSFEDGELLSVNKDDAVSTFEIGSVSPVTLWRYDLKFSHSTLLRDIAGLRNVLFAIAGSILFVCLLLSLLFTNSLYRPIRETMNILSIQRPGSSGNELEEIKSNIITLKEKRDELEETEREHIPILISYYYSVLLFDDREHAEKTAAKLEKIIGRLYPRNRVCVLNMVTPSGVASPVPLGMNWIGGGYILNLGDAQNVPLDIHTVHIAGRTVFIARYEKEESFSAWLDALIRTIPGSAASTGGVVERLAELPESYAGARRDAGFALARSDLLIALKTGNLARSQAMIREMFDSGNPGTARLLQELFFSLSSDAEDAPPQGELHWALRQAEIICSLPRGGAIDGQLLLELTGASIQNPQLSLQYIADRFSVSPSLVSKAFKETSGQGFNHYINARRLELAKRFLSEGYDVQSASRMAGYSSDVTFRRLFKDAMGLRPSEYKSAIKK